LSGGGGSVCAVAGKAGINREINRLKVSARYLCIRGGELYNPGSIPVPKTLIQAAEDQKFGQNSEADFSFEFLA
jgi:hypothetical protein